MPPLDASLLTLPLRKVIPATPPRVVATASAIAARLDAGGGRLYRYLHDQTPEGDEGAFVLCSFWLVDNAYRAGDVWLPGRWARPTCRDRTAGSSLGEIQPHISDGLLRDHRVIGFAGCEAALTDRKEGGACRDR
ncbi:glycoside hydrolase family 15 protein [Micromonospora carbonacea]|uniref:glycoside hydrolase family 15 protein n=1 Tax=Micromonospora carbonacea TaxID=47853 RepID=UPI0033EC381B